MKMVFDQNHFHADLPDGETVRLASGPPLDSIALVLDHIILF